MCAASQLPVREPTDWMMLLHLHAHLNVDDDENEYANYIIFIWDHSMIDMKGLVKLYH